jgi:hypothetical protein
MASRFATAMGKVALLGQNPKKHCDCSAVIPVPKLTTHLVSKRVPRETSFIFNNTAVYTDLWHGFFWTWTWTDLLCEYIY